MKVTYALASERVGQKANKSKRYYDIKVHCSVLSPADRVLVLEERWRKGRTEETQSLLRRSSAYCHQASE